VALGKRVVTTTTISVDAVATNEPKKPATSTNNGDTSKGGDGTQAEHARLFTKDELDALERGTAAAMPDESEEYYKELDVTGLRATHQLGATYKLCVTHILSINQISVGGLTANEYALDWVPLC